jgi:hypothetical protein
MDRVRHGNYKGWKKRREGFANGDVLHTHDGISQTSYSATVKEDERIARRTKNKRVIKDALKELAEEDKQYED